MRPISSKTGSGINILYLLTGPILWRQKQQRGQEGKDMILCVIL